MNYSVGKSFLWYSGLLILVMGIIHLWLPGTAKEFYINLFDKYYIINNMHLTIFLSFLNLALGSGYFLLAQQGMHSPRIISLLHVSITILSSIGCWIMGYILNKNLMQSIQLNSTIFGYLLIVLVVVQLLYFINLIRILSAK